MSIFTSLETVVDDAWNTLVPSQMKSDLGSLAAAFVSNIKYDAKTLGKDAEALAQSDIATIWAACKTAANQVATDLVSGKFSATVAGVVTELTSVGATDLVPALVNVGKTTLTAMVTAASQMVVSGAVQVAAATTPAAPAAPAAKS